MECIALVIAVSIFIAKYFTYLWLKYAVGKNFMRAIFHYDNRKLICKIERKFEAPPFTWYLWQIHAIRMKREEKSRETTGTWKWKCIYNPFCHLPSADNFLLISQRNSGSKWNDSKVWTCNIIIVFAGSSVDIRHLAI